MQVLHHPVEYGTIAYGWSHEPSEQPLVVLHGLGDSSIHTYAPRFRSTVLQDTPTLFVDLPGFGEGVAGPKHLGTLEEFGQDSLCLLRALGVSKATLFAHSMGANIALLLSAHQHNLFHQLILAEPLLDPTQSVLAAGIARYNEDAFVSRGYAMLLRATSLQSKRGDTAAIAFLPVLQMANPVILHRAATSLLTTRTPDFKAMIRAHTVKTHLIIGGNTPGDRTQFQHSGVEISEIPNAGHFMIAEQCYATACAILDVVNRMLYGRS